MTTDVRRCGAPPVVRPPASRGTPRRAERPSAGLRQASSAPPVRTDPRIAARRIAVKRDEGRRRLRRLAIVAGIAAVIGFGALLTQTPLLDVDHVRLRGVAGVSPAEVHRVLAGAGVAAGEPLVRVDESRAEAALEAMPAVADARVERHWPGTVTVVVDERVPVATVAVGDRVAMVAADGVVVDVVAAAPAALPTLAGAEADPEPGSTIDDADGVLAVAAALPPPLAGLVEVIDEDRAGEVSLQLVDGLVARLGPAVELESKLVAAWTILDQVGAECVAVLDVRVPSAPAVTPADGCRS